MATGSYVWRDSQYGQRLILTLSRSGATVTWALSLQCTGAMYATMTANISGSTSASKSYTISQGGAFTQQIASGSFSNNAAVTVHASSKMFWGGTCTVSDSIGSGTPAPGKPQNLTTEVAGLSTAKYTWSAVANADKYFLELNTDGGGYASWASSTTAATVTLPGMGSDCKRDLRIYASGPGGVSSWAYAPTFYSDPARPTKPKLDKNKLVSWTLPAKYFSGYELQHSSDGGTTWDTIQTGTEKDTSFTHSAMGVTSQYRVRSSAGTGALLNWSNWSDVSDEARDSIYSPPVLSSVTATRTTSAGVQDPKGTTVKLTVKGSITLVAGNKWKLEHRTVPNGAWVTVVSGQTTEVVDRTFSVSGFSATTAYTLEVRLSDSYTEGAPNPVIVPIGKLALSLGKDGLAAGKQWVEGRGAVQVYGALDLQDTISYAKEYGAASSTNTPPSWYYSNAPQGVKKEYKTASAIGLGVLSPLANVRLETDVPTASYLAAAPVVQTAFADANNSWRRHALSAAEWSAWVPLQDPNVIVIDGTAYQSSGVMAVPDYTLVGTAPLCYQSFGINMPLMPPAGWGFSVTPGIGSTVPSSLLQLDWGTEGRVGVLVQSVRADGRINSLTWQLIKL